MTLAYRPLGNRGCRSRRSRSAATCSAGRRTSARPSRCSMPSSRRGSTSSTPPMPIRCGCRGTGAASRRRCIGKWLKSRGNRDKVIIATKLGVEVVPGEQGLSRAVHAESRGALARSGSTPTTSICTSRIAMIRARPSRRRWRRTESSSRRGRCAPSVRRTSLPNVSRSRSQVSAAKGLPRYESLQPWYNLYDRAQFEEGPAPLCRRENIGVVSYFSLASGFLTGKYRSESGYRGQRARLSGEGHAE